MYDSGDDTRARSYPAGFSGQLQMMKGGSIVDYCPVCKTYYGALRNCPECGFDTDIIELQEALGNKAWEEEIIWPWRKRYWESFPMLVSERNACIGFRDDISGMWEGHLDENGDPLVKGCIRIPYGIEEVSSIALFNDPARKLVEAVVMPDTVKELGDGLFEGFENLEMVVLSKSLTSIPVRAFANSSISFVSGMDNILSVLDGAFYNCKFLYNFTLPARLQHIGRYAFFGAGNSGGIYPQDFCLHIPETVCDIGEAAFALVNSVTIDPKNMFFYIKDDQLLSKDGKRLLSSCVSGSVLVSSIVGFQRPQQIPEGVEYIDEYAFYGRNLDVRLANSVVAMGESAFDSISIPYGCKNFVETSGFLHTRETGSGHYLRCLGFKNTSYRDYSYHFDSQVALLQINDPNQLTDSVYTVPDCFTHYGENAISLPFCKTLILPKGISFSYHAINCPRVENLVINDNYPFPDFDPPYNEFAFESLSSPNLESVFFLEKMHSVKNIFIGDSFVDVDEVREFAETLQRHNANCSEINIFGCNEWEYNENGLPVPYGQEELGRIRFLNQLLIIAERGMMALDALNAADEDFEEELLSPPKEIDMQTDPIAHPERFCGTAPWGSYESKFEIYDIITSIVDNNQIRVDYTIKKTSSTDEHPTRSLRFVYRLKDPHGIIIRKDKEYVKHLGVGDVERTFFLIADVYIEKGGGYSIDFVSDD